LIEVIFALSQKCFLPRSMDKHVVSCKEMFEHIVLTKVFGCKRDEVSVQFRILHSEEFYDLHTLPSIVRRVKPGKLQWVGHLTRM
jgi:hypothetical protein